MLSTDTNDVTRVWDLTSPIAGANLDSYVHLSYTFVTPDWNWQVMNDGKEFWPLHSPDPMWVPERPRAFTAANAVAWNADHSRAATLETTPDAIVVRLWSLAAGPPRAPLIERRFPMQNLGKYQTWSLSLAANAAAASVLIGRTDFQHEGLWIADLLHPREALQTLGGSGVRVMSVRPDLRWMVVERAASVISKTYELVRVETSRAATHIPIRDLQIDGAGPWSPDGRWLVLNGRRTSEVKPNDTSPPRHHYAVDVEAASARKATFTEWIEGGEYGDGTVFFLPGRPPLARKGGTLYALQSHGFVQLLKDPSVTELSWDRGGQWLALTRGDRVVVAPTPTGFELGDQIRSAMHSQPLPLPSEPEARGKIYSVFPFPDLGWVVASAENDRVLLWHRAPDGAWQTPLVFTKNELRIDWLRDVQFRPDGRMALFGDQVMRFEPTDLMNYSRRLLAGRSE